MEIGEWETAKDLKPIYEEIRALGLEPNLAEHDAFGFTVVPPEKVGPAKFTERLLDAVLRHHGKQTGQRLARKDLETASLEREKPIEDHLGLVGADEVFEEALRNRTVLALARYFCGRSVLLSDAFAMIKQRHATPTPLLHIDQVGAVPPLPPFPQSLNITWPLTRQTRDDGALAMVPASHRFGRIPQAYEMDFLKPDAPVKAVPIACEPGSLIAFGGTTWSGAFPRVAEGLGVTFVMMFCRPFMKQLRDFRDMPKEVLDRNPPEFAMMLGVDAFLPRSNGNGKRTTQGQFKALKEAGRNPWG